MNTHSFNQFDKENEAPNANLLPVTPTPRRLGFLTSNQSNTPVTRPQSLPTKKSSKTWLNGYQVKPKTPSYAPYKDVSSRGKKGADALSSAVHSKDLQPLKPLKALDDRQWNHLATQQKLIRPEHALAGFQIEAANYVTQQAGDLVVIAPTGAGKSLTWVLPLIARNEGISLVIVPFTSLGHQGEQRHYGTSVGCTFIHSKSKSLASLRSALNATGPHVIYICPEMLEGPRVAQVLHTARFKSKLSAIYIDEAHCVHENKDWRPAYGRLKLLRKVVGTSIPLVCLSATLPQSYCDSLETNAALSANYHLINLGNFRPELSIIVHRMEYQAGTFQDLRFLLPWNSTHASVVRTIVYCDDISMLTAMFWWFEGQLIELNLPKFYIDILHASLSEEHQKKADNDFRNGRTRILLGTEKIGLGMGYEGVQVVVQYKCRDLTLVQWEQRRGRGAQRAGETAVGIIMVEKTMTDDDGSLSVTSPKQEDPGLLDLIQNTSKCKQAIVDHWLRHPSRPAESCQRCSHCNPQLRVAKELTWIMEDPSAEQANAIPSVNDLDQSPPTSSTEPNADKAAEEIFEMLKEWRMKEWRENWTKWRRYGPENIVNDADLLDLSKRARQITTLDELFAHSHIPHWPRVCDALFAALCDATAVVWGSGYIRPLSGGRETSADMTDTSASAVNHSTSPSPTTLAPPTTVLHSQPLEMTDLQSGSSRRGKGRGRGRGTGRGRGHGRLSKGEQVLDFGML